MEIIASKYFPTNKHLPLTHMAMVKTMVFKLDPWTHLLFGNLFTLNRGTLTNTTQIPLTSDLPSGISRIS